MAAQLNDNSREIPFADLRTQKISNDVPWSLEVASTDEHAPAKIRARGDSRGPIKSDAAPNTNAI